MQFIDGIKLLSNPPVQYQTEGAIWVDSGKLKHRTYNNEVFTLAYEETTSNPQKFIYQNTTSKLVHVINHNLGSDSLFISVQEVTSGKVSEYVLPRITPTVGNELNSVTIETDSLTYLHVELVNIP